MRRTKLNSTECVPSDSVQVRLMRISTRAGESYQHLGDATVANADLFASYAPMLSLRRFSLYRRYATISAPINRGIPSAAMTILPNDPEPPSATEACITDAGGSLDSGTAVGVGVGSIEVATVGFPTGTGTAVGTAFGVGVGGCAGSEMRCTMTAGAEAGMAVGVGATAAATGVGVATTGASSITSANARSRSTSATAHTLSDSSVSQRCSMRLHAPDFTEYTLALLSSQAAASSSGSSTHSSTAGV